VNKGTKTYENHEARKLSRVRKMGEKIPDDDQERILKGGRSGTGYLLILGERIKGAAMYFRRGRWAPDGEG